MKLYPLPFVTAAVMILAACNSNKIEIDDWDEYITEHEQWQETRLERLKSETGWLNLAGLYWLEQGDNTFGSDSSNSIIFPLGFPDFGGKIILTDSIATMNVKPGVEIRAEGEIVDKMVLKDDHEKNTTILNQGNFRWFIIKRGSQYGIRLRNLDHPRIAELDHIPAYEFNKDYVVEAEFVAYDEVKRIEVPTVIPGFFEYYDVPGELTFKLNGKHQTLMPFAAGNGYFIIVGDETNGLETYGAGRFLYTDKVKGNKVIIDFNKAYNPPCAFSPFATCPLPPVDNILDVGIKAGEKAVHMH